MIKKTLKGVMWWLAGDTDNSRHKVWCNNMNGFKEVDMTEAKELSYCKKNDNYYMGINDNSKDKEIEDLKERVRSLEKKLNKIDGWDD